GSTRRSRPSATSSPALATTTCASPPRARSWRSERAIVAVAAEDRVATLPSRRHSRHACGASTLLRMPSRTALDQSRSAADRIVQGATTLAVSHGVAHVSLQDVAEEAGVSKGLIHYHFHDRETLLARLAESLSARTVARQSAALHGTSIGSAVDDLWVWVDEELRRGQLRVLIELGREPGELPRRAAREAVALRREAGSQMVARLFQVL